MAVPPSEIHWPEECCVCGKPATRRPKVEGNKSQTGANVSAPGVRRFLHDLW